MLKHINRFHGHGSLRYVYKNGAATRSGLFVVKASPNPRRKHHARVAVVVSKKTHKSAVGRNRIRRRMYEIIRHELPHLDPLFDIVIIITSADVRMMPALELYRSVREQLIRAGLYKNP